MTFKNKKEEVIEIELTSFGKYRLSSGHFNPSYYSFFDDDILYDAAWASTSEPQNYSQTRILEETPVTRVQVQYYCVEDEVERQIEEARISPDGTNIKTAFQETLEKNYTMSAPLGRSLYSSENIPSWDVAIYGSKFSQTSNTVNLEETPTLRIPQLTTMDLEFTATVVDEVSGTPQGNDDTAHAEDIDIYRTSYDNGNYIEVDHNDIIIEIDELHTDSLLENYDIEFFLVETDTVDGNELETLSPLLFHKSDVNISNVVNDILIEREDDNSPINIDETYAEFYLQIDVDSEISKQSLCELGYRTDYSKRSYIKVDCDGESTLSQMPAIYESDTPQDPFGDDC